MSKDNELAFSMLFDKYWKVLSNHAFKALKDREAAHDIVQQIFVDLWTKRKSLTIDHVSSYLYTAVKYRVINYIQKHEVPMESLDFVDGFRALNTTEEVINLQELDLMLRQSIDELPDQCRKVFRMSRFDHLSNKEIAEKLNISNRTVENHIAHAIRLLRPQLNRSWIGLMVLALFFS